MSHIPAWLVGSFPLVPPAKPWKMVFSSIHLLSGVHLFAIQWTAAHQDFLYITSSRSLLKLMFIESVMPSNPLILYYPLLLPPSVFPSITVFSNESVLQIRWPKYWSFSFSISHSNEYSGLISFRMDWLDLLAVQRALKSLLQHHSSKASVLSVQLFETPWTVATRLLCAWDSPGKSAGVGWHCLLQDWLRPDHFMILWPLLLFNKKCIRELKSENGLPSLRQGKRKQKWINGALSS